MPSGIPLGGSRTVDAIVMLSSEAKMFKVSTGSRMIAFFGIVVCALQKMKHVQNNPGLPTEKIGNSNKQHHQDPLLALKSQTRIFLPYEQYEFVKMT